MQSDGDGDDDDHDEDNLCTGITSTYYDNHDYASLHLKSGLTAHLKCM